MAVELGVRDAFRLGWAGAAGTSRPLLLLLAGLRLLTGFDAVRPFADERLELLRVFAAMSRRRDLRATRIAVALRARGMSAAGLIEASGRALRLPW